MRARWKVVLVDEFQDTDPVQWQVLDRAFSGHATLVLIGDPKQAIYAFRGGDVATYLAAETSRDQATLAQNWRSDAQLVDALQVMIGDAELGDPKIVVRPVAANHPGGRLVGARVAAPLRLAWYRRDGSGTALDDRPHDACGCTSLHDLAADIARLLGSGAPFDGEPVGAGDMAVLVRTRKHAPCSGSPRAASRCDRRQGVLLTPAADEWLALLEALEQPHRSGRVRVSRADPVLRAHRRRARSAAKARPTSSPSAPRLADLCRTAASPRCSRRRGRRTTARVLARPTASGC